MDKNKASEDKTAVKEQKEPAAAAAANQKDALAKQLDDYKDSLQRLQAEFENYKKRVDREKAQFRQFAVAEVVKSFLPVLDSFELALKSISNSNSSSGKITTAAANPALAGLHSQLLPTCADEKVVKGLELIYGQFYSALESHGLRPVKGVGEKFDPYKHEVLMQEETSDSGRDGVIVEEFQKGYALNEVILRYSKVKVLKFKVKEGKVNGGSGNRSDGRSDDKNKINF